jgi:uncharacterized repeat protein (TIGR01451 family)
MSIRRTVWTIATSAVVLAPSSVALAAGGGGGGGGGTGADIQVTGSASTGSPAPTQTYTYTYQVKNSGPQTATSTVLTTSLPAGETLNWAQLQNYAFVINCLTSVDASGTTQLQCPVGDVASGAQQNILINVTAPPVAGTVLDTASVSSSIADPKPSNNSYTVTVNVKSAACALPAGQPTLFGLVTGAGSGWITLLVNGVTYTVSTNYFDGSLPQPVTFVVNLLCQQVFPSYVIVGSNVYVTGIVDTTNNAITATVIQVLAFKDPGA